MSRSVLGLGLGLLAIFGACRADNTAPPKPPSEERAFESDDDLTGPELEAVRNAVERLERGADIDALEVLAKASREHPANIVIAHEYAFALVKAGELDRAALTLGRMQQIAPVPPASAELLGSLYDQMGDAERALAWFRKSIERYPEYGGLYTNKAIVHINQENYDEAARTLAEGMMAAPEHASNYYWAARLYSHSTDRIWTLLYGETYCLLAPTGDRFQEMSDLMFEVLKASVQIEDTAEGMSVAVALVGSSRTAVDVGTEEFELPFGLGLEMAWAPGIGLAAADGTWTLAELQQARSEFVKIWWNAASERLRKHPLLEHVHAVHAAGHGDAYTAWVFGRADVLQPGSKDWFAANAEASEAFFRWMTRYPLRIRGEHPVVHTIW